MLFGNELFQRNRKNSYLCFGMRYILLYMVLVCVFVGCTSQQEKDAIRLLGQAESLMKSDPWRAHAFLDSIEYPELISREQNARWCMMSGKLADTIHTKLPYVHQLERAQRYFDRKGTTEEQAQIGLYLGRAYMEEKLQEPALQTYFSAFQKSLTINNYDLAGYICSYMGDVYEWQAAYDLSKEKYQEAIYYFELAGNKRSQGIAYRDMSRSYAFRDLLDSALICMFKADSILRPLEDSLDISTIYNGLGNIYLLRGEYKLAEEYLIQSIKMDTTEAAPSYLALASNALFQGNLSQAEYYLQLAQRPTINRNTHSEILYCYSELEEHKGNIELALSYLKEYIDSTEMDILTMNQSNLVEAEKKYQHKKIIQENVHLRKEKNRIAQTLIYTVLIALSLIILFLYRLNRKNKRLYTQELELNEINTNLLQLKNELSIKQNHLNTISLQLNELKQNQTLSEISAAKQKEMEQLTQQLRKLHQQMLQTATIAVRVRKLATQVVANAKKSPLNANDWKAIHALIQMVAPDLSAKIAEWNLSSKEENLYYLSFFNLGTNGEAVLLNLLPDTVNRYRQKLRKAFQIKDKRLSFSDFLLNQL